MDGWERRLSSLVKRWDAVRGIEKRTLWMGWCSGDGSGDGSAIFLLESDL
jgi:hypothetical protein